MYEVKVESPSISAGLKYIRANCDKIEGEPGFYKVHTPLKVFKKAYNSAFTWDCIISLEIPAGATVYAPLNNTGYDQDDRKMRASEAKVESILKIDAGVDIWKKSSCTIFVQKTQPIKTAFSMHEASFKYEVGKTVTPRYEFSYFPWQCESGIHFFVNPADAISY